MVFTRTSSLNLTPFDDDVDLGVETGSVADESASFAARARFDSFCGVLDLGPDGSRGGGEKKSLYIGSIEDVKIP